MFRWKRQAEGSRDAVDKGSFMLPYADLKRQHVLESTVA